MKYERTYIFLEEFLKWNFEKLPSTMSKMICGSPSFAAHLWLALMRMKIPSTISIVLFDNRFYEDHKDAVEEFLSGKSSHLHEIPAHFVTTIEDEDFEVHFDSKGDITSQDRRIRSIHSTYGQRTSNLIHRDKTDNELHGTMLSNLKTVMSRMHKMNADWVPGGKNPHWRGFTPYWEALAPLGDDVPRGIKKSKRIIRK
jgi:hypothetical protein